MILQFVEGCSFAAALGSAALSFNTYQKVQESLRSAGNEAIAGQVGRLFAGLVLANAMLTTAIATAVLRQHV